MKILIRGAGDLATGIASRLYACGHQILMTEIAVPLTVRRQAALSRAVYEETAKVENLSGILAHTKEEARDILSRGDIPVLIDEKAEEKNWFAPDVIVDAILAKENVGTTILDAPFVIGVGPGFKAGEDCHCVIETKRGHTLGRVIWDGSALPNTGVPGDIGGYTVERLIRASAGGMIEPVAEIGDYVEEGQTVAFTGGSPVKAGMSGIVRGMLQGGVFVQKGMKIGDIDARCEREHCHTISDKAKAVGGGILEAVTQFEHMRGRFSFIVLAAGQGKRFGDNKLMTRIHGEKLYEHLLEKIQVFSAYPVIVVTGYEEIKKAAEKRGFSVEWNDEPKRGISHSLKLGLDRARKENPYLSGALFMVCDQPNLRITTIQGILNEAFLHPGQIVCAGRKGRPGNPVLWDRRYFPELFGLSGDQGGRQILRFHTDKLRVLETAEGELKDIDRQEDLESLRKEERR